MTTIRGKSNPFSFVGPLHKVHTNGGGVICQILDPTDSDKGKKFFHSQNGDWWVEGGLICKGKTALVSGSTLVAVQRMDRRV